MDHAIRESTISFLKELNREERAQAEARETMRLATLQQEAERREQYKQDVRDTISSLS
jgi:hypothetical protein